ncbi:hypothetical protein [Bilophila wadsworthia]|nr:hypothetical protein [Bilophila wadsworthia]
MLDVIKEQIQMRDQLPECFPVRQPAGFEGRVHTSAREAEMLGFEAR